jgi:hypothetical protein
VIDLGQSALAEAPPEQAPGIAASAAGGAGIDEPSAQPAEPGEPADGQLLLAEGETASDAAQGPAQG